MADWNVLVTAPRACSEFPRYRDALEAAGCQVTMRKTVERLTEVELLPLVGEVDGIVCGDDRITATVMAAAPRLLKVIAKWGTGIDGIDLVYAAAHGIAVRNTPDAFTEPVADTALGYMLMFARGLDSMARDMRNGHWRRQPLRALRECTVGIIGLNIGRAAAAAGGRRDAQPATAASRRRPASGGDGRADPTDGEATASPCSEPARRQRHFSDAAAAARPPASSINTAPAQLIEEARSSKRSPVGRSAAPRLDVFEDEPLSPAHPLRTMLNVYWHPTTPTPARRRPSASTSTPSRT